MSREEYDLQELAFQWIQDLKHWGRQEAWLVRRGVCEADRVNPKYRSLVVKYFQGLAAYGGDSPEAINRSFDEVCAKAGDIITGIKAKERAGGLKRRILHYVSLLRQGQAISPTARPDNKTLVEWMRHCKRNGLYAEGKLLYEKGGLNLDALPEELMVHVEEDYSTCVRLLARAHPARTGRTRARKVSEDNSAAEDSQYEDLSLD